MDRIKAILIKEWREVFKNKFVLFTVSFLPIMITALPLVILYFAGGSDDFGGVSMADLPPQFMPLCGELGGGDCMLYYIVTQFILLFMMVPVIIPMTIASYSIVGEKTTRTLEPLLATPVSTIEILVGKGLAGVIPAVVTTWAGYLIYAAGAHIMVSNPGVVSKLFDPLWMIAIFLVGPLLSLMGVSIAVMISSRVNDPRVAEQISGLFVLPVVGLFIGQTTGFILINEQFILWMAVALVVLDSILFYFAVQVFQRETILSRWK
ncbi:MAG: ABC transporter permease subunit [Anaerolineales bacterium]|nr:ABC transporter permease subunit [Anaerolineales bacterium]